MIKMITMSLVMIGVSVGTHVAWSQGEGSENQDAVDAQEEFSPTLIDGKPDPRIRGFWESRGYGWILVIDDEEYKLFDHSSAGCHRVRHGTQQDLSEWWKCYWLNGETLRVSAAPRGSSIYTFQSIESLPPTLETTVSPAPQSVFHYFFQVMQEQYAFFDIHDVDWDEKRELFAPSITDDMSDERLFEVLCKMMKGIEDDHLLLVADIEGESRSSSNGGSKILTPALNQAFAAQDQYRQEKAFRNQWVRTYKNQVATELLQGKYTTGGDGLVVWGRVGKIGYLNILNVGGFAPEEEWAQEVPSVNRIMDTVLADLSDTDGLVMDLTLNHGGYDEVALAIASHFMSERTFTHSKFAYRAEDLPPQEFFIDPSSGVRYLKPVTVVTSDETVSGGELLTMAMRAIPNVTHAGVATRGALSDMLSKKLPNGWELSISNETYLDSDGVHWEGLGVEPDWAMPIFDPQALETGHVRAIRQIIDTMAKKKGSR